VNLHDLAKEVAKREGKKKSVDIAQIKEVIKILFEVLEEKAVYDADQLDEDVVILIDEKKQKKKPVKKKKK
jgi:hypothetical protein